MLNDFIISIAIIAHVLGISLPAAIEEDVYIVPTVVEQVSAEVAKEAFEWRVDEEIRSADGVPARVDRDHGPDIQSAGALVMDVATQRVLWQKNPDAVVPIASITKLMTALVWMDHQPADGLEHVHTFAPEENTPMGKELNLPEGEKLKAFDLLRSSIVGSDNDTALALAHTTGFSDQVYVGLMNEKARALSMKKSTFVDQTGLSAQNVSTPHDIARLAREAFSVPEIQQPAKMSEHRQETVDSHRLTRVFTTNKLLYDSELQLIGGKTGYTEEAGYCLVVQARVPNTDREVIVVVLGAPTEQGRFDEAKKVLLWTFSHYAWPSE